MKYIVQANSISDFECSLKDGLLYYILYQGKKIGIISAIDDEYIGKNSMYITEIIIEKEFKGKKFATAAQRKFIEENKKDFTYVWGKISEQNIPSLKNALRVGRMIISSEVLLPINH